MGEVRKENDERIRGGKLLRTYFYYHIPTLLTAALFFLIAYLRGVHTQEGFYSIIMGAIMLIMTPPISYYMTKKKYRRIYTEKQ